MAWQFARLKVRLIRNGFRAPQYLILFLVGATGAGLLAFIGFVTLAGLRDNEIAANATLVTFAAVTVSYHNNDDANLTFDAVCSGSHETLRVEANTTGSFTFSTIGAAYDTVPVSSTEIWVS